VTGVSAFPRMTLNSETVAARFRAITPQTAAALPICALHIVSWFVLALVTIQRWHQYVPSPWGPLVERWAVGGLVLSTALLAVGRVARRVLPFDRLEETAFNAYAIATTCGIALLVVPLFLLLWRTKLDDVSDWSQALINKRWLSAMFLLAVGTFLVLPSIAQKLLIWDSGAQPAVPERERSPIHRTLAVAAALAIGWILAGPPWHIAARLGPIDFYEQGYLGPIQALWNGYLPDIGPASTTYGPGTQFLIFEVMKQSSHFDIVSFREGFAALHLITALSICAFAAWTLGLRGMIVAVAIGVYWSPLGFFRFGTDGSLEGFWGWANSMRYLGALVVAPTAVSISFNQRGRAVTAHTLLLGMFWGVTAWMAQENLSTTFISTTLVLALVWATDSSPARTIVRVAAGLLIGFVIVWTPVLGYYALHGKAFAFIRNYLSVPLAASADYQNSWWTQGPDDAHRFSGLFLVAIGLLTLFDVRRLQLRRGLDAAQARLLAFVLVLAACYETSIFRADTMHLVNTMIALPFVVVLLVRDLPFWIFPSSEDRTALRCALVAVVLAIFPLAPLVMHPYVSVIKPVLNRFKTPEAIASGAVAAAEIDGRSGPGRRIPAYLATGPLTANGGVSMPEFVAWASDLKQLVGDRKTYIEFVPTVLTGLVYFAADLRQGPYQYDRETMVLNGFMLREWFSYFNAHVSEFDCVITQNLFSREAEIFLKAFPETAVIERRIGPHPFYVLLRNNSPGR
jgi:hypothetical protein